jgi:hypothetical protein
MIGGGLEGCGPSQPLLAVNRHHIAAPTERTPSRESAGNVHPVVATMIGGGLEMRSLAAVAGRKLTALHGADGADALQGIGQQCPCGRGNDDRWRPGGLRSLAAVAGRKLTALHGADGADALQESASNVHAVVAPMTGGGLEMRSLAAVADRK